MIINHRDASESEQIYTTQAVHMSITPRCPDLFIIIELLGALRGIQDGLLGIVGY